MRGQVGSVTGCEAKAELNGGSIGSRMVSWGYNDLSINSGLRFPFETVEVFRLTGGRGVRPARPRMTGPVIPT